MQLFKPQPLWKLTIAFIAIIGIRMVLEFQSSLAPTGVFWIDLETVVHAYVFYGFFALLIGTLLTRLLPEAKATIPQFITAGMLALLIAPVIDLLAYGPNGAVMSYLFIQPGQFISYLITFFGPLTLGGVTLGMRFMVASILTAVFVFAYQVTKSIGHSLLTIMSTYACIFLLAASPSLLTWIFAPLQTMRGVPVFDIVQSAGVHSVTAQAMIPTSVFNTFMSSIWIIALVTFGFIWLWNRAWGRAVLCSARLSRAVHLMILFTLGASIFVMPVFHWITIIEYFAGYAILLCVWLFTSVMNDQNDMEADQISHPSRAIVNQKVTRNQVHTLLVGTLAITVTGALNMGIHSWVFLIISIAIGILYSVPPFRLRRYPLIATAVMGSGFASVFAIGSALSGITTSTWHGLLILSGILVLFSTLFWNVKDLPDVQGDAAAGYKTIPVLFPQFGKFIVAGLAGLSFIVSAFCLMYVGFGASVLYAASLFSAFSVFFVLKWPNRLNLQIILYFSALIILLFTIVLNS